MAVAAVLDDDLEYKVEVGGKRYRSFENDSPPLHEMTAHLIMYQLNFKRGPVCISMERARLYYQQRQDAWHF